MKAYKATYNLKCLSMEYKIGETYTFEDKLIICKQGFHFCKKAQDTLNYYDYNNEFVLMEIEVLGDIIDYINGDKSVTNQFKAIRIISKEEYPELIGITLDEKDNIIKRVYSNGDTWLYEYDENNNKIKEVYPNGETWLYEYNGNNNCIKRVYPNGDNYLYEYDSNNNLTKKVYSNGGTWLCEYDKKNNVIKKVYPDGSISLSVSKLRYYFTKSQKLVNMLMIRFFK